MGRQHEKIEEIMVTPELSACASGLQMLGGGHWTACGVTTIKEGMTLIYTFFLHNKFGQ